MSTSPTILDTESRRATSGSRSILAVPGALKKPALRKLLILDAAEGLEDLRVPPGNRLEKLEGDRSGQHGIRIDDRYRICFVWRDGAADAVEIVDYH